MICKQLSDGRGTTATAGIAALAILAVASGVPAVMAQPIAVDLETPDLAATPEVRVEEGAIVLSIDEALAIALERNLSLIVERYNEAEAGFGVLGARGIYDLTADVELAASSESSPTVSVFDGADIQKTEFKGWDFRLTQPIETGGSFVLDFDNSRFETNSTFSTLNPRFGVDFDLEFRQPLLRDRGRLATERNLTIAQVQHDISRETFELQVAMTIQFVENAYWTLVEARRQAEVAEESLELARRLHEQNEIRVEVGTLAPLELVQSEAGVATRQEEIIRTRAAAEDAADELRQLLNLPRGAWTRDIVPDTEPRTETIEIDVEAAIATALDERPELATQRMALRNLQTDVAYFQNQRKPRLDLLVRYGFNGLGGDFTERAFDGTVLSMTPGDYGDALDQVTGGDFDGWLMGLNISVPIQNRFGKAQAASAAVARDRGEAILQDLELQVATDVRRAARALKTSMQQIQSAEVSRRLAERNLEAEQKRYDNGMSTSFRVLEIQEDLSAARSREVAARTGHRRALADYFRSLGTLLEESEVSIED